MKDFGEGFNKNRAHFFGFADPADRCDCVEVVSLVSFTDTFLLDEDVGDEGEESYSYTLEVNSCLLWLLEVFIY